MKDYKDARFIERVTPTYVDFGMHSRPFFLAIFDLHNYWFRTHMQSVVKHIPLADARWIGDRLGRLSSAQIADCFRAAGFSPADIEGYSQVVMQRIAALRALGITAVMLGAARVVQTSRFNYWESGMDLEPMLVPVAAPA